MAGTDGNRTVTGVAAGAVHAASTDAVNGSQLHSTNTRVAAVETTQTQQGQRITAVESTTQQQGQRLTTVEGTVERHGQQITAMQGHHRSRYASARSSPASAD